MSNGEESENRQELDQLHKEKLQIEIGQLRDTAAAEKEKLDLEVAAMRGLRSWIPNPLSAAVSLLTALAVIYTAWFGNQYIDQQQQVLEIERKMLGYREEAIEQMESAWQETSKQAVDEPSGLAATGIDAATGALLALVVDDEVDSLFLLRSLGTNGMVVWKVLGLEPKEIPTDGDSEVNDLESVCFDGNEFHAFASHRRMGRPNVMRILHFELRESNDRDIKGPVKFESDGLDPERLAKVLTRSGVIKSSIDSERITINGLDWTKDDLADYHYALQVEGAACNSARIWLGLRNPVAKNGPIVLIYKNDGLLGTQDPEVLILDTSEIRPAGERVIYGISALDYFGQEQMLFVALNPPELERYGASIIATYRLSEDNLRFVGFEEAPRGDAKLEGLAVVGSELWLTYDGERPYYQRRSLKEHPALLGR